MKSRIALSVFTSFGLIAVSAAAMTLQNAPIPGIDVVVKKQTKPRPTLTISGRTDSKGNFWLRAVEPGTYELTLDGRSLRSGVAKAAPDLKTSETVNVSLGLLLPAVQKVREAAVRSGTYRATGEPAGLTFTFDLPAPCVVGRDRGCTGKADYLGTVTLGPASEARLQDSHSALQEVSTTR